VLPFQITHPIPRALETATTESLVYLRCWTPCTQKELLTWIYGTPYPTNKGPVKKARDQLIDWKCLRDGGRPPGTKDRRVQYLLTSDPWPVIPFIQQQLGGRQEWSFRKAEPLSKEEGKVLFKILDSNWFRTAFDRNISSAMSTQRDPSGTIRHNSIYNKGLLSVAEFLGEIAGISSILGTVNIFRGRQASTEDLLETETFDQFLQSQMTDDFDRVQKYGSMEGQPGADDVYKLLPQVARELRSFMRDSRGLLGMLLEDTIDMLPFPALCIPLELAEKLSGSSIGRVHSSLFIYLSRSIERVLVHKTTQQEDERS